MARRLHRPSRRATEGIALGLVVATIAGFAVVAPGFDATRTPVDDGSVWAIQSGENPRYGRVNLEIGELDIVKPVGNPTAVLQSTTGAMVFTSNYARYANVSAASPTELLDDAPELLESPAGTESVQSAGETVIFVSGAGEVFVSAIGAPPEAEPRRIDLEVAGPDAEVEPWSVDAVALSRDGLVVGWSAESRSVSVYDLQTGSFTRNEQLDADVAPGADAQVSIVDGRWVLLDPRAGVVIVDGRETSPTPVDLGASAALQRPSTIGDSVLVSDDAGLLAVPLNGGASSRIVNQSGIGVPAAPTELSGVLWAAWLAPGIAGGTLWSSKNGEERALDYAGLEIGDEPQPVLQTTGSRMALNDVVSGWVWSVPDGEIVPSSQDWTAGEQEQEQTPEQEVVSAAVDPKPPVVVDDAFGVRGGATVTLPVLLNDSDPNGDVLTIVPSSVEGLDPAFGIVTTAGEDQTLVIQVAPGANGSATLSYRAEDGTADGGLVSEAAAVVTLTVIPDSQENSAPVWCGVDGCTAERPSVQVGPGSSIEFDWLKGWVDPDGDPIFVSRVAVTEGRAVAAATDAGRILLQHTDPNEGGSRVQLAIAVSDVRGAETVETFDVPVSSAPSIIAESFAVVAQAGAPVEIDPAPYMTGGSGPLRVVSAIPTREGRGEVLLNPATGIFTFSASAAGSYLIDWTVSDGVREQLASVRVTLREAVQERLTVAPVIAFVRPQEDASVDVFSAVSNPAQRVLLLSEVSATSSTGSSLFASTVGRDLLRVSGTTGSLQPGLLGEVGFTVSDGTGRPEGTARGSVTVYLLPTPPAAAPIAVDDSVVVRAGDRVDVPVLENDVAVLGNAIVFDPRGTQADAGLAFTTSRAIRILAPDEPGSYAVRYTIYSVGYPALSDVATVFVTVLPAGPNSDPAPSTLIGRVVSGGTVSIPFSSLGVDPDGDEVVLDAILEQPRRGVARISSDGRSIVYTSLVGDSGEVTFLYRVRDASGLTGEAGVRVGVLAADEDPSPIAYSDYVQVTLGPDSLVVVRPLENDVDPAGTGLKLLDDPVPNVSSAEGFEEEYQAARDRITSVDGEAITFSAGDELGTFSYFYDVVNEFGDVSRGTIVIRVVRESVVSAPIVTDTILTAETRSSFTQGVDVVSGRVAWSGGDVSNLQLSLWSDEPGVTRDEPGVTVQGSTIRGDLPDRRTIIPFKLTGEDFLGQEVVSYGFIVVPGPLDLPPTVRMGADDVEVKEREQVAIDLESLVVTPADVSLEIDAGGVRASGQRSGAECRASDDLGVTYVAAENSPWRDFCIVPVRYVGQAEFTYLAIAVRIIPGDPQPELRSASLEVSPGSELVYELGSMTTWQGDKQTNAVYSVSGSTGSFEIIADASTQSLKIIGLDIAVPGTVEVASIGITNPEYEGVLPAGLTLRVGPAPATLPKGGAATQECGVAENGTQCTIRVIGVSGEVNPLPGTPLVITAVTQPQACSTVSFAVAGADSIVASWTQSTPGAVCAATFTVRDAQKRESAADRNGTVILDFQGLPNAAASVSQVSYGDGTARLAVIPGAAASAYPPLTGFDIVRASGGEVVASCDALGVCSEITGLRNGERVEYRAFAVNSQGRALTAPSTEAWSYKPPPPPAGATFTPTIPSSGERNGWPGKLVTLTVLGVSDDTAELIISRASDGVELRRQSVSGSEVTVDRLDVGSNTGATIVITTLSEFDAPPGPQSVSSQYELPGVHGVAAPVFGGVTAEPGPPASNSLTITPALTVDSPAGATIEWFVVGRTSESGPFPSCGDAGAWSVAPASRTLAVEANRVVEVGVCARTVYDEIQYGLASATTLGMFFVKPDPPVITAGYVLGVNPTHDAVARTITWALESGPEIDAPPVRFQLSYFVDGVELPEFPGSFGFGPVPAIEARYCHQDLPAVSTPNVDARCSDPSPVSPTPDSLPYPLQAAHDSCVVSGGPPWAPGSVDSAISFSLTGESGGGPNRRADYIATATIGAATSSAEFSVPLCPTEPAAP